MFLDPFLRLDCFVSISAVIAINNRRDAVSACLTFLANVHWKRSPRPPLIECLESQTEDETSTTIKSRPRFAPPCVIIIARARLISRGATWASRGTTAWRSGSRNDKEGFQRPLSLSLSLSLSRLSHSPLFSFTAHVRVNIMAEGIRGRKKKGKKAGDGTRRTGCHCLRFLPGGGGGARGRGARYL